MNSNYFHPTVSKKNVANFIEKTSQFGNEIYAIEIYQKNELMLKFAIDPYDCEDKAEVYSLSKSFTSTAIGIAVDEGLLTIEDDVLSFFEDERPDNISSNLKSMKVKHLLSMNTGHEDDTMLDIMRSENGISEFLNKEVQFEPGTHFTYNTGASYMLSAIITKVSGYSLFDYISLKLFIPLGITGAEWDKVSKQYTKGGYGLHICCEDISKLASLYLNDGVYNGKRYLSSEWVKLATSVHSDNSSRETPDWKSGYGFQFWVNAKDGFRGDGAFGQLMVVLPKYDMTVAIRAGAENMQQELDCVYELAENLHNDMQDYDCDVLNYSTLKSVDTKLQFADKVFICEENQMGISWVSFTMNGDNLCFNMSNAEKVSTIIAGLNCYVKSEPAKIYYDGPQNGKCFIPVKMASCYSINGSHLELLCRSISHPLIENIIVDYDKFNKSVAIKITHKYYLEIDVPMLITGVSI